MIRPSAGTTSPASSRTMSPGTSLVDSISATWPERRTRACGTCSFASASTLARAFSSWLVPITTLNSTRPSTTRAVAIWTMAKLAATTNSSMMFIGLTSCSRATTHMLGGGSVGSSFGPYSASRRSTSATVSPASASTPICVVTSCADSAYQARPPPGCSIGSSSSGHLSSSMTPEDTIEQSAIAKQALHDPVMTVAGHAAAPEARAARYERDHSAAQAAAGIPAVRLAWRMSTARVSCPTMRPSGAAPPVSASASRAEGAAQGHAPARTRPAS